MSNSAELFKKLTSNRLGKAQAITDDETGKAPRRGRPATGKRSDPDWIGRTYYIRRETDLDIEGELLQLRRQGIEMDKDRKSTRLNSSHSSVSRMPSSA